jgi:hypothetical protein
VTSLRLWILVLTLVSAAGGFAAGLLVYGSRHAPQEPERPFQDYERLLVERFELSPERQRLFQAVLAGYNDELDAVKDRWVAESMSQMEPELSRIAGTYRARIRNHVLPEDRRVEFDRMSEPLQLTPQ